MSHVGTVDRGGDRDRREQLAIAFFGTWTIIGLFVDGWAHQADKPETFFTPWHGLLYSGFVSAVIWFAIDGWRATRRAVVAAVTPTDRLTAIGLVLFVAGAVGDGVWHEVFGIEVNLEALLSPTHLLLMTGGLLMLSAPVRWALSTPDAVGAEPTLRRFLPVLVAITLCASLATFFTMYLGAHWPAAGEFGTSEFDQSLGVASVLARNALVMAPLLFAASRWRLPVGTFTIVLTTNAVFMAALEGFDFPALVIPFVVGGIVGDALVALRQPRALVATIVPIVLWSTYMGVHAAVWGMPWPVEVWTGAVFLAGASSYGLSALIAPRPISPPRPA